MFDARSTVGGSNSATGSGTTPTTTVTVAGANGIVIDSVWTGNPAPSVGAGQTQFWNEADLGGSRDSAGSYEAHTGSDVTMSWSMSSDSWAIASLEVVEEVASGGGSSSFLAFT